MCFQKERSVPTLKNEFRTVGILWAELPGGVWWLIGLHLHGCDLPVQQVRRTGFWIRIRVCYLMGLKATRSVTKELIKECISSKLRNRVASPDRHYFRKPGPDPQFRIKVKMQEIWRLKLEPWRAMERSQWRRGSENWKVWSGYPDPH